MTKNVEADMTRTTRRVVVFNGLVLGLFGLASSAIAQHPKPTVEREAVEKSIKKRIEELNQITKDGIGYELTPEQKRSLSDMIIIDIENQGIYAFDPTEPRLK